MADPGAEGQKLWLNDQSGAVICASAPATPATRAWGIRTSRGESSSPSPNRGKTPMKACSPCTHRSRGESPRRVALRQRASLRHDSLPANAAPASGTLVPSPPRLRPTGPGTPAPGPMSRTSPGTPSFGWDRDGVAGHPSGRYGPGRGRQVLERRAPAQARPARPRRSTTNADRLAGRHDHSTSFVMTFGPGSAGTWCRQ